jgi:hypothetical protein
LGSLPAVEHDSDLSSNGLATVAWRIKSELAAAPGKEQLPSAAYLVQFAGCFDCERLECAGGERGRGTLTGSRKMLDGPHGL